MATRVAQQKVWHGRRLAIEPPLKREGRWEREGGAREDDQESKASRRSPQESRPSLSLSLLV